MPGQVGKVVISPKNKRSSNKLIDMKLEKVNFRTNWARA
jgi:hypothetical protein